MPPVMTVAMDTIEHHHFATPDEYRLPRFFGKVGTVAQLEPFACGQSDVLAIGDSGPQRKLNPRIGSRDGQSIPFSALLGDPRNCRGFRVDRPLFARHENKYHP
jgi:hypothetical protein